jgi:hypothetical protein
VLGAVAREVVKAFQASVVAPVDILDDQEQWLLVSLAQEIPREGSEELMLVLRNVRRWPWRLTRGRRYQVGNHGADDWSREPQVGRDGIRWLACETVAE